MISRAIGVDVILRIDAIGVEVVDDLRQGFDKVTARVARAGFVHCSDGVDFVLPQLLERFVACTGEAVPVDTAVGHVHEREGDIAVSKRVDRDIFALYPNIGFVPDIGHTGHCGVGLHGACLSAGPVLGVPACVASG